MRTSRPPAAKHGIRRLKTAGVTNPVTTELRRYSQIERHEFAMNDEPRRGRLARRACCKRTEKSHRIDNPQAGGKRSDKRKVAVYSMVSPVQREDDTAKKIEGTP